MKAWLQFFRIVNLPTVPGDVLVGAAAVASASPSAIAGACVASCLVYLFGLADNDIVGAKTDGPGRPIPSGAISPGAARVARGLCLFLAMIAGAAANLPPPWWIAAFLLALTVVVYNRTKWCLAMGLCRGLNVACGGAALAVGPFGALAGRALPLGLAVGAWTLYIAFVTRYSAGEESDPAKRRRVGFLVGAIVYLQLAALLAAFLSAPNLATRNLLLAGAGLLILLRVMRRTFPKVSAS